LGGTANLPAGTYNETIKVVGTSGLGSGVTFESVMAIIHTT
jgi:hypothetical protein